MANLDGLRGFDPNLSHAIPSPESDLDLAVGREEINAGKEIIECSPEHPCLLGLRCDPESKRSASAEGIGDGSVRQKAPSQLPVAA
jgi:hypothetical protein